MISVLPLDEYNSAWGGSVSGDGRFVAFHTHAPQTGNDVYLRDRFLETTTRITPHYAPFLPISAGSDGTFATVSGDGRFVAFHTQAAYDDLDLNRTYDVYVYDRLTTSLRWASRGLGLGGATYDLVAPTISDDGRFITFASNSSAMVAGDTNSFADVFVYDQESDETHLVSVGANGIPANAGSHKPSISGNGRYVAFQSYASDLLPAGEDTNGVEDIFIRDLQAGTTKRISVTPSGAEFQSGSTH